MDYKFYGDGFQAHHIGPLGLYPTAGLQVIIQNSVKIDRTAKWFSTYRHIDYHRVLFIIGFGSVTPEVLVRLRFHRYTHWSVFHNRKLNSRTGNGTETHENRKKYDSGKQQHWKSVATLKESTVSS